MNCPSCKSELESVSGDYGTGVYAPDGYQEHRWQEGYYCKRCDYVFDADDVEQECNAHERWIFTFGFGHTHPVTGESLAHYYVVIEGDINESREIMDRHFGKKWAMQYPSEERAGVEKYGLTRIDLPDIQDTASAPVLSRKAS